jgi:hypothetical protein
MIVLMYRLKGLPDLCARIYSSNSTSYNKHSTPHLPCYSNNQHAEKDTAEMLDYVRRQHDVTRSSATVAVARSFGCAAMNPRINRQGSSVDHADNTDDAKEYVHETCGRCPRDGPVMEHRLE